MITCKENTEKSTDKILEQRSKLNEVSDIKWEQNYFTSVEQQSGRWIKILKKRPSSQQNQKVNAQ